jgi:hypothetical protein
MLKELAHPIGVPGGAVLAGEHKTGFDPQLLPVLRFGVLDVTPCLNRLLKTSAAPARGSW